ncbi:hypothetical protein [[Actinomadura] parvosata]|uniref:hypothetical protein n=1 Tax=[Actinomadura] parvosata TaxID=1955412 RepID=UPI0012BD6102|nr:hypothetical protein [Nonomuraea sp. ATCC 55076]
MASTPDNVVRDVLAVDETLVRLRERLGWTRPEPHADVRPRGVPDSGVRRPTRVGRRTPRGEFVTPPQRVDTEEWKDHPASHATEESEMIADPRGVITELDQLRQTIDQLFDDDDNLVTC